MTTVKKIPVQSEKKADSPKGLSKEEMSAYILYTINGCTQIKKENPHPTFIGSYH